MLRIRFRGGLESSIAVSPPAGEPRHQPPRHPLTSTHTSVFLCKRVCSRLATAQHTTCLPLPRQVWTAHHPSNPTALKSSPSAIKESRPHPIRRSSSHCRRQSVTVPRTQRACGELQLRGRGGPVSEFSRGGCRQGRRGLMGWLKDERCQLIPGDQWWTRHLRWWRQNIQQRVL